MLDYNTDVGARCRKIHWEDDQKAKVTRECLLYDGVPFHILGKKVFCCEFGKNKYAKYATTMVGIIDIFYGIVMTLSKSSSR